MKRNHLDGSLFETTIESYFIHLKFKLLAHNILETTLLCTNYTGALHWEMRGLWMWLVPLLLALRLLYSTMSIAYS